MTTTTAPHWRNNDWKYHSAASHHNSDTFRKRQQQRLRQMQPVKPKPG